MINACCEIASGGPWATDFVHHGTDLETVWEGEVPHLTPNDRFFVRNHTRPAVVDAASWRLLVTGDGVSRRGDVLPGGPAVVHQP